jgi:putative inorganic carbon (HCO3(-)) transporter
VAVIAALAALIRRLPVAFPILAFALLPLRVPVEVGGETANLLIPLYGVIVAATAAAIWARWRDRALRGDPDPGPALPGAVAWPPSNPVGWLQWLLAATLVLYAAQSAYTEDVANAIEVAGFFLIPFAVMFSLLLEVDWDRRLLGLVLAAVAAMATLFAGVAIYQYAVRDLFLNEELLDSNQLHQYFRVNSLFFDPNILGRYLALAVTGLAAYIAWGSDRRLLAAATLVAGASLAGLAFSFSITSFAALLAGFATLALLRWGLPGGAVAAGMAAVAALALLLAGGAPSSELGDERRLDSGRTDLVSGGLELAADRPVAGWGSGSFGAAFWERIDRTPTTVSHSEPVTVAAEQGAIGLGVYLPLVVVSLLALFAAAPGRSMARGAVAACFVVMLVHSIGYAGFAIDPATWALLALGAGLRGS